MRVLFVQPALPAYRVPFFRALAKEFHLEVWADLRARGSLPSAPSDGFVSQHCPEQRLGPLLSQPALLRAVSGRADVLVFPWNARYLELGPALLAARAWGMPALVWGHGYSKSESAGRRVVRNALGRLARGVVLYSHREQPRLVSEGFDAKSVFVAQNAIDRAPIEAALGSPSPSSAREFAAGRDVVVFSSRLEPDKRPHLLLEALAKLPGSVALVILGDGPLKPGLEAQAAALGIDERVKFLGAIYDESQIAPWMTRAQLFVYPASIGLSLLHAFHYALPVVTSDALSEHNPEIAAFGAGLNGATFRDGDANDLARVIEDLLAHPERRQHLSRGALETVTRSGGFTLDAMVSGMARAIRAVAR